MSDEKKMQQLQLYEQSLNTILAQKQQFQTQLSEIQSAIKELKNSTESYRIIGNIMVKTDKENLQKDLDEKEQQVSLRMKTLTKQEDDIKEKTKSLREQVMEKMKDE